MAEMVQLFWGVDPFSEQIARGVVDLLPGEGAPNLARVFLHQPDDDAVEALRDEILRLKKDSAERGPAKSPELIIICSLWEQAGLTIIDCLDQIQRMLEVTLTGDRSMVLVLLMPDPMAGAKEKTASFEFLLKLEPTIGTFPDTRAFFINPAPLEPEDSDRSGSIDAAGLKFIIAAQISDPELSPQIGQVKTDPLVLINQRKSAYATCGRYRLEYDPDQCLAYLIARLNLDMFAQGMHNHPKLDADEYYLGEIKTRADHTAGNWSETIAQKKITLGQVKGPAIPVQGDRTIAARALAEWQDRAKRLISESESMAETPAAELRRMVGEDFRSFIDSNDYMYAGAGKYLEALLGQMEGGIGDETGGVKALERDLVFAELAANSARASSALISVLAAQQLSPGAPPPQANSNPAEDNARSLLDRFQDLADRHCASPQAAGGRAEQLIRDLVSGYEQTITAMAERNQRIDELTQDIAAQSETLNKKFGFFKRTFGDNEEYKKTTRVLQNNATELEAERLQMTAAGEPMSQILHDFINNVAAPYLVSARLVEAVRLELEEQKNKLSSFVGAVDEKVKSNLSLAEQYTRFNRFTAKTLLNDQRLQILYVTEVEKGVRMEDRLKMLFDFLPTGLNQKEEKRVLYCNCPTPSRHLLDGPQTLMSRMLDYSTSLTAPLRDKNALDIIELEGDRQARKEIKDAVEKTRTALEFSPGRLPLLQPKKPLTFCSVVKSSREITDRLNQGPLYQTIFSGNDEFHGNHGPYAIEIITIIYRFPAFLIHALTECRELYRKQNPEDEKDLWP